MSAYFLFRSHDLQKRVAARDRVDTARPLKAYPTQAQAFAHPCASASRSMDCDLRMGTSACTGAKRPGGPRGMFFCQKSQWRRRAWTLRRTGRG